MKNATLVELQNKIEQVEQLRDMPEESKAPGFDSIEPFNSTANAD